MDMMPTEPKRTRQQRSPELKAKVLAECEQAGASLAQVALAHGVKANLVHGWRKLERERRLAGFQAINAVKVASAAPTEVGIFRAGLSGTGGERGHDRDRDSPRPAAYEVDLNADDGSAMRRLAREILR